MKGITVTLTKPQVELVVYELGQSLRGDDDAYDKRIKAVIKKLEGEKA